MENKTSFDVIIVGGSYAGLSSAMALGRAFRNVLIIDSGKPCNAQTPHAHNIITHDGQTPAEISKNAKEQVLKYDTIQFHEALATDARKTDAGFEIITDSGQTFHARKLIFATGIKDVFPSINGFAESWGISALHCPYCHGYEVRNEILGVVGNGETGFQFSRLIHHWSKKLTLFTNGSSTLTAEQTQKLKAHNIEILEQEIASFAHHNGQLRELVFKDGTTRKVTAVFAHPEFEQHCKLPEKLGCALTEKGYIEIDDFHRTTVPGIYAAGDNTSLLRALPMAIAAGNKTGAIVNKELIEEDF